MNEKEIPKAVEQTNAPLAAANPTRSTNLPSQADGARINEREIPKVIALTIKTMRATGVGANRRKKASAATHSTATADNVIGLMPKHKAGLAAATSTSTSSASADIEVARRRMRALAIVERYANYSAASGFIPLPIANVAAITGVIVRMVRALNELYGVPFEHNRAYGIAIGLVGGILPTRLANLATSTIVHFVPGYNLIGLAVSSVTASAYARRVGRMLIDDFERQAALERERSTLKRAWRWHNIFRMGWLARTSG